MPSNAAKLVIEVTADAHDAVGGFDDVTSSARDMARGVEDAGRAAQDTSRKIGLSADAADELGGKAGKATGALGALSSGFELVGAEKYAGALQAAGMATDFMSGVGDSLNLVMESTIVQNARARVATVARTVAEKAAAAGTAVMTAGQWALNAAMSANPIALVVIALVALVAGFVLAYKKSETFRNIVQAVGRAGREAIGWVVSKIGELVGWFRDRLPGAAGVAKTLVVGYLNLITLPLRTIVTVAGNIIGKIKDIPGAVGGIKDRVVNGFNAMLTPVRALIDLIESVLEKIKKIKLPKLPDVNPFSRTIGSSSSSSGGYTVVEVQGGPQNTYTFNISGAIDPEATARQIRDLLFRYDRSLGTVG